MLLVRGRERSALGNVVQRLSGNQMIGDQRSQDKVHDTLRMRYNQNKTVERRADRLK